MNSSQQVQLLSYPSCTAQHGQGRFLLRGQPEGRHYCSCFVQGFASRSGSCASVGRARGVDASALVACARGSVGEFVAHLCQCRLDDGVAVTVIDAPSFSKQDVVCHTVSACVGVAETPAPIDGADAVGVTVDEFLCAGGHCFPAALVEDFVLHA